MERLEGKQERERYYALLEGELAVQRGDALRIGGGGRPAPLREHAKGAQWCTRVAVYVEAARFRRTP